MIRKIEDILTEEDEETIEILSGRLETDLANTKEGSLTAKQKALYKNVIMGNTRTCYALERIRLEIEDNREKYMKSVFLKQKYQKILENLQTEHAFYKNKYENTLTQSERYTSDIEKHLKPEYAAKIKNDGTGQRMSFHLPRISR